MLYDNLPGRARPKHTPYSDDHAEYEETARTLVSSGQLLSAIEVIRDGIKRFGSSPVLQQQLALALAQTGALDSAREILNQLTRESAESAKNVETLSLFGRVYKEMWRRATDPKASAQALQESSEAYGAAFELSNDWYPGINFAFTLLAAGKSAAALESAERVEKICRKELKLSSNSENGWLIATLAEAMLHQGATDEAAKYYAQAAQLFAGRWRDLISMRRQAREIIQFREKPWSGPPPRWYSLGAMKQRAREFFGRSEKGQDWLDRCFEFPSVVVFAGHMIDHAGRASPRFPAERETAIRDAIRAHLRAVRPGFGYSSAACGADLIFCECMLELGAKLNLVLPCSIEAFKRQSVSFAGPDWEKRFHAVLGQATSLLIASSAEFGDAEAELTPPIGFVYANRIVTGLAVLHARSLDFELKALALWDGKPGDNDGGTASVVAEWERRGLDYHILHSDLSPWTPPSVTAVYDRRESSPRQENIASAADFASPASALVTPPSSLVASSGSLAIKTLVSAEIVNFQHVSESQFPAFTTAFKGAIGKLVAATQPAPSVNESWGKFHSFVFDDLHVAAEFALKLRDEVAAASWVAQGLPAELGLRIVVHAGPVFAFTDPVTQRATCIGSHAVRAERIAPVTPAGQVYVSQEFAALCSGEDMPLIGFEFLGRVKTAKLFDEAPLYRLDWRRPNEPI